MYIWRQTGLLQGCFPEAGVVGGADAQTDSRQAYGQPPCHIPNCAGQALRPGFPEQCAMADAVHMDIWNASSTCSGEGDRDGGRKRAGSDAATGIPFSGLTVGRLLSGRDAFPLWNIRQDPGPFREFRVPCIR